MELEPGFRVQPPANAGPDWQPKEHRYPTRADWKANRYDDKALERATRVMALLNIEISTNPAGEPNAAGRYTQQMLDSMLYGIAHKVYEERLANQALQQQTPEIPMQ